MMTSDQVRTAFLKFFEGKGHTIIPSSSLIPAGDPTLLLTTAGMVQIKPYFMGELTPPNPRLASCQKCFRMTDIDSVGDNRHLTFFEMLGNFSVGDYFKREAIAWGWEFVTKHLKLPESRLRVTIFRDDDEAFAIWKSIGVNEKVIYRLGEKDNFWGPAGNSGPCGPCSEIHYDFGESCGCGSPDCGPGCSCGRFSEIWNLVFTQYNQDKDGKRTPLPRPNIDTGMGLERTTAIMQGKQTVYETNLFAPLIDKIAALTGTKYGAKEETDHALRVIAEHSRGITFLIGDGVIPGNEGRGYVLRRLLRRTSIFARRLDMERAFLSEMAEIVIKNLGGVYPEIIKRREFILKVINLEEARFEATLNKGLELIENIMAAADDNKEISGADAFRLYDTFGFPVELTEEIAGPRGFKIDKTGFEQEMAKQREKARSSHKFENEEKGLAGLKEMRLAPTVFAGYGSLKQKSSVLGIIAEKEPAGTIGEGQPAGLVLEATPFYGEMGGQVGDTGEIIGPSGHFRVENTVHGPGDVIVHEGRVSEGIITSGEDVEAVVDTARRFDIARNHTATHLLQFALRKVLGEHVQQRGSLVAPERLRFDFSHLTGLTEKEIADVQVIINEKIRENLPVYAEEMTHRQALDKGATALFGEKYGDTVRVLQVGRPPVSMELCGGTHVAATGEIGFFQVVAEGSVGAGIRRIEAVTGREAEELINRRFEEYGRAARLAGAKPEELPEKLTALLDELEEQKRKVLSFERQSSRNIVEELSRKVENVKGINVLAAEVAEARPQALREMGDMLRDRLQSGIIVLGTVFEDKPSFLALVTPDLTAKGYHAGKIIKAVAAAAGGGGGGRPEMAQAGGKDKTKLGEALSLVKTIV